MTRWVAWLWQRAVAHLLLVGGGTPDFVLGLTRGQLLPYLLYLLHFLDVLYLLCVHHFLTSYSMASEGSSSVTEVAPPSAPSAR